MKLLDFFSITQKLAILLLFLLSAVSYLVITTMQNSEQQQTINIKIEVAKQQNLIAQRFINALLLSQYQARLSASTPDKSALNKSEFLFTKNANALLSGGYAYRDIEMSNSTKLSPTLDLDIKSDLVESQKLWAELQTASQLLRLQPVTKEQLSIVNHLQDKLQNTLNKISNALSHKRQAEAQQKRLILQLSWLFIFIVGVLFSWSIAKNITQPLNSASKISSRIRFGDLQSYPDSNNHRDELGTLLYQTDEMRLKFSETILEIQQHNKQIVHSSEHLNDLFEQMSHLHLLQVNQHRYTEKKLHKLQQQHHQSSQLITQQRAVGLIKQKIIDSSQQGVQTTISGVDNIQSSFILYIENITHLQQDAAQLFLLLENLAQVTIKTEALAKKATIDAASTAKHSDQFTLVANQVTHHATKTADNIKQISPLLAQLKDKIDNLIGPIQQAEQQFSLLQEQLRVTQRALHSLKVDQDKQQSTTLLLEAFYNQQQSQIDALYTSLNNTLQLIEQSSDNTEENLLFMQELHKIAVQLDQLSSDFKTDKRAKKNRRSNDKRSYPRIKNQLKVSLQQGDNMLHGLTMELSLSGLKVKSLQPISFNATTALAVSLNIPDSLESMTQMADLIHYEQQGDSFFYSIRFQPLNKKNQTKIQMIFDYFEKNCEFEPL